MARRFSFASVRDIKSTVRSIVVGQFKEGSLLQDNFFTTDVSAFLDEVGRFKDGLYEEYRPTISVALMTGNQVLFVQSSKRQVGESASWLLPQGGVVRGETVYQAIGRELGEEVGLDFSETQLLSLEKGLMLRVVGGYINDPRPSEQKPKVFAVVAMQVERLGEVRLNAENSKYAFAHGPHVMWQLMRGTRHRKFIGTLEALDAAHRKGLIGWSCREVLDAVSESMVAA